MSTDTRIQSLETQVRELKESLDAMVNKMSSGVISANEFRVVNKEGNVVACLEANVDGGMLSVLNKVGKRIAEIKVLADGGLLIVSNKDGKAVAALGADAAGGGAMITMNITGQVTSRTP